MSFKSFLDVKGTFTFGGICTNPAISGAFLKRSPRTFLVKYVVPGMLQECSWNILFCWNKGFREYSRNVSRTKYVVHIMFCERSQNVLPAQNLRFWERSLKANLVAEKVTIQQKKPLKNWGSMKVLKTQPISNHQGKFLKGCLKVWYWRWERKRTEYKATTSGFAARAMIERNAGPRDRHHIFFKAKPTLNRRPDFLTSSYSIIHASILCSRILIQETRPIGTVLCSSGLTKSSLAILKLNWTWIKSD